MSRSILIAAAAAMLSLSFGAAHAEDAAIKVSAHGLNLAKPSDARIYYQRLSQAAADACGGWPTYALGNEEDRFQACHKVTLDDAINQIHAPLVTAARDHTLPAVASR